MLACVFQEHTNQTRCYLKRALKGTQQQQLSLSDSHQHRALPPTPPPNVPSHTSLFTSSLRYSSSSPPKRIVSQVMQHPAEKERFSRGLEYGGVSPISSSWQDVQMMAGSDLPLLVDLEDPVVEEHSDHKKYCRCASVEDGNYVDTYLWEELIKLAPPCGRTHTPAVLGYHDIISHSLLTAHTIHTSTFTSMPPHSPHPPTSHVSPHSLLDSVMLQQCDEFRRSYTDILYSWKLLDQRAEILKYQVTGNRNLANKKTCFVNVCRRCGAKVNGPVCKVSRCYAITCSICSLSVKGTHTQHSD